MRNLMGVGITPITTVTAPRHSHSVWEILYFTEQRGILRLDEEDLHFEPGDLICLPPDTAHSEHSDNGYGNIYFTVSEFDLPSRNGILILKDAQTRDIGVLLGMLYKEFHLKRNRWRELTEQILGTVYAYAMALLAREKKTKFVERLEEALVANIGNAEFKLDRCMGQFPLTRDYLRRTFKKETGMTPVRYLTELRIESAKRLFEKMYGDELSVKFVASQVGFDDPYYFSRVFKAVTGLSPMLWMKRHERQCPLA